MGKCVYYSGSPNFGDAINPILYRSISHTDCTWVAPETSGKILMCGSVAHEARPRDVIWGTGCISENMPLKCDVTTQVLAVRGPLSAELLYKQTKNNTEIYCDPGLLLSRYIPPQKEKLQKIGIIPHYTDRDLVTNDPILKKYYIDIMSGVSEVIKRVTTCNYIISSALHGIICAESYGIPALWVEFSDNVAGNGFKFKDYYLGTNRHSHALNWRVKRDLNEAVELLKYSWTPPEFDGELLLSVCPFKS